MVEGKVNQTDIYQETEVQLKSRTMMHVILWLKLFLTHISKTVFLFICSLLFNFPSFGCVCIRVDLQLLTHVCFLDLTHNYCTPFCCLAFWVMLVCLLFSVTSLLFLNCLMRCVFC